MNSNKVYILFEKRPFDEFGPDPVKAFTSKAKAEEAEKEKLTQLARHYPSSECGWCDHYKNGSCTHGGLKECNFAPYYYITGIEVE